VISTSDFKKGTKILIKDEPYAIIEFMHVKPGKGGAFVRTKMRNMITDLVREETFRSGEKFKRPDLSYSDMQYLYEDDGMFNFMDQESYEQIVFNADKLTSISNYLKEQAVYTVLSFNGSPISMNPPLFMELEVTETPPGVRGDTVQGAAYKTATLETGLVVQVPLFVNEGDFVKIDTRNGAYMERVKK
jgi:elongation factor P